MKKKPFVLQVEDILNTWNHQNNPRIKTIIYPVIPPWFNLENMIEHDLVSPTTKEMGKEQNKQSVLETLRLRYNQYKQIYTDGSKSTDTAKTGAGFYAPYHLTHSSWRLHNESSIVSAEMSAIHIATSWLLNITNPDKIVILTDSDTSLHLINHRKPKQFIHSTTRIHENIMQLTEKGWKIKLQWIPSHCDISGNDIADQLAKHGRSLNNITFPLELNDIKQFTKKQLIHKWQTQWDAERINNTYSQFKPIIGNWYWCRHGNRALDVIMTKLRLGKVGLNKYLEMIELSPTDLCENCNSGEVEDINHYLLTCQKFRPQRVKLKTFMNTLVFTQLRTNDLLGAAVADQEDKKKITNELGIYILSTQRFNIQ